MRERSLVITDSFTARATWDGRFVYDFDDFPLSALPVDIQHQIVEDLRCSKTYGETRERDWDFDVSITAKDGKIEFEERYEDLPSSQQESIIQSLLQNRECGRIEVYVSNRYKVKIDLDGFFVKDDVVNGGINAKRLSYDSRFPEYYNGSFMYDLKKGELSVRSESGRFFERNYEQLMLFLFSYISKEIQFLSISSSVREIVKARNNSFLHLYK